MSRRVVIGLGAAVLVLAVGWGFAQKPAEEGKPEGKAPEVVGRYTVAPVGSTAVLLDTAAGKAWVLTPAADGEPSVWLPTVRLDTDEEVARWRARQRALVDRAGR